ncbi:hypothetical protein CY652_09835 [Burkholderia sp. WAC0059]|nr:hypothetical protein CY652_09835 [Burkholderia sp. WAC0059]
MVGYHLHARLIREGNVIVLQRFGEECLLARYPLQGPNILYLRRELRCTNASSGLYRYQVTFLVLLVPRKDLVSVHHGHVLME